jgi:hypothetical protein
MATYIYLPIPTQEFREYARKLEQPPQNTLCNPFLSGKGKAIARFFSGCLSGVKPWDELLLISHGNTTGSNTTAGKRGNSTKVYTPVQLARAIEEEGLTKSHITLKLLVCGSARNEGLQGGDPFGKRVCAAMKDRGYNKIEVTGYHGNVSTDGGKITVLRAGVNGGKYYPANIPGSYTLYK